jgi:hypothetical protein
MYKITSRVIGSVKINGKSLGYNGSTIVSKLTEQIIDLQGSKIITVELIPDVVINDSTIKKAPAVNGNVATATPDKK